MATIKLLTFSEAADAVGLHESTVRRLVQRGEFAAPLILSPRRIAFREKDVEAWLNSRPVQQPDNQ